jgi:hypothetical protein
MTAITVEQAQAARPAQNFVVVVFDGVAPRLETRAVLKALS